MKIYDFDGKKNICGERVKQARRKQKITQSDLAARLQIAGIIMERDSISRIEIGTRFVADYEIVILAKCLNVKVAWLLGVDESI
ncbi:MAG: helix-turn-helix transcriptional regulator [Clostridia bacterium]|nr:helix-turn-helix transcriptional regulator [Clostridia bacterium]